MSSGTQPPLCCSFISLRVCYLLLHNVLFLIGTWVKIVRLMFLIVSMVIVIDMQHEFIRDARSHERKIRIELKDFIDRMKKKKGQL